MGVRNNLIRLLENSASISRKELLSALCSEIDLGSQKLLAGQNDKLVISTFNRDTLLRMLEMDRTAAADDEKTDSETVLGLIKALQSFLSVQMKEQPEGHRWIILSCCFLVFVVGEPMHPQSIVHWELEQDGVYRCPARTPEEESICRWCVCCETAKED